MPDSVQVGIAGLAQLGPALGNIGIAVMAAGGPMAALGALKTAFMGLGTLLTMPAGAVALAIVGVVALFMHWDEIGTIAKRVYNGVKEWLVDKFEAIVGWIGEKVGRVTGFFSNLYDQVVGNSFVPDLIERIAEEFARLDGAMVAPARAATGEVTNQFAALLGDASSFLDRLMLTTDEAFGSRATSAMGKLRESFTYGRSAVQGVLRGMAGDVSGWVDATIAAFRSVKAWWDGLTSVFRGGEEGVHVNPARDKFLSQFGPGGTGPGSGFHNLAAMLTEITGEGGGSLFSAMTAADTMDKFRSAAQAIVDLLESHGKSARMNFHTGGVVPGAGEVSARLLGGEGVLSHRGMRTLDAMNRGDAPRESLAPLAGELREIRATLARLPEMLSLKMRDAANTRVVQRA